MVFEYVARQSGRHTATLRVAAERERHFSLGNTQPTHNMRVPSAQILYQHNSTVIAMYIVIDTCFVKFHQ
jgi:hypothetical protein